MKTPEEAMDLIENMAASDIAILRDRLLELTSQDALLVQNKLLSKQLEVLTETLSKLPTQIHSVHTSHSSVLQVAGCTICGGAHESGCCIPNGEQVTHEVNYMGNQPRKILMQVDFLDSSMDINTTNNRDNGGTTLGINSIETKWDSSQNSWWIGCQAALVLTLRKIQMKNAKLS